MSRYEQQFFEYLEALKRYINVQPLILGATYGSGGGLGGRAGGFIGTLPQTRVSYDLTESETLYTPPDYSGASLLDNLNHIRYRIGIVESGMINGLDLYDEDILVKTGVTILNFEGPVEVTDSGTGRVDITISGVQQTIFTAEGELEVSTGNLRIYNLFGATRDFLKVFLSVGTPPSGQNIIVDVNKNGTTIFTNQANRPQIVIGEYTGYTTNIDVSTWENESYLTMDIDQAAGSDLTVHIVSQ